MERVTGIGGLFFRAKDPAALARWYRDTLGIDLVPADYSQMPWSQEAGSTAFSPFAIDTDYFGNMEKQWMINFRVRNLDAMVAQLRAMKIEVRVDPEPYPNGRFARLHDPEDNPIELWEPK
jgi:glyoxylase I family protein